MQYFFRFQFYGHSVLFLFLHVSIFYRMFDRFSGERVMPFVLFCHLCMRTSLLPYFLRSYNHISRLVSRGIGVPHTFYPTLRVSCPRGLFSAFFVLTSRLSPHFSRIVRHLLRHYQSILRNVYRYHGTISHPRMLRRPSLAIFRLHPIVHFLRLLQDRFSFLFSLAPEPSVSPIVRFVSVRGNSPSGPVCFLLSHRLLYPGFGLFVGIWRKAFSPCFFGVFFSFQYQS